jgi:flagellar hook protein FlgE
LGQIALASFLNSAGLVRAGQNNFGSTSASGAANIGKAGAGGRGTVTTGVLEMSNVDLATQFTSMITAERGFQANSRVITTSDEMLQELVNLKR